MSASDLPELLYVEISVKSIGGHSLFDESKEVTHQNVSKFFSEDELIDEAVKELEYNGFQVLAKGDVTINVAGTPKQFEDVFKTKIVANEKQVLKSKSIEESAMFMDCPDTKLEGLIETKGSSLENLVEGIAISEPVYYHQPSPTPPQKDYWHLTVPEGVRDALRVEKPQSDGIDGRGVKIVMVDSGWYRHPFFAHHGYNANSVVLGPGASAPDHDESGHGTGESANIFAVAPKVDFTMVKMNFRNAIGSFNTAVNLNPQIVTNSWGSSIPNPPLSAASMALSAAISSAVLRGIIVVFSAGNGHWGFPGQHPDVISAGGVFMDRDGSLQASDYASGFISRIFPNRPVPDISGLVGMQPGASYIMLPVEPRDEIDRGNSGGSHPPGDETAPDDGWAAFSGTSAAAPQLAGLCALVRQSCPNFSPKLVRRILKNTARDVVTGRSHPNTGGQASVGPDNATGFGLVDAEKAVRVARRMCG